MKQQSVGRHVTPLRHIILIPNQPVFALSPYCCMFNWEATNTNFIVFGSSRPRHDLLHLKRALLTIKPPMSLHTCTTYEWNCDILSETKVLKNDYINTCISKMLSCEVPPLYVWTTSVMLWLACLNSVSHWFEPQSDQIKYFKTGISSSVFMLFCY